ncbi:M48 family metallopeptidase [Bradyrhizobium sp. SZCCHNR1075]|uniref:M48 family metallopeptidase n=1 Tax=Bradyrhizobium sp. SZCCHNR1075 TaxID=3057362 RepID=UPI0028E74119|nr:M48 family metallopeptidase [Bradyrhizobium sp. SZCCHNR1075]
MSRIRHLPGLHPYEYEHPFDAKALDALQSTVGLDAVVREFNEHGLERYITVQYTGSNLRISPDSYPKIHALLDQVCDVINLPSRPDLYLEWGYHINGFTVGVDHPIIVLTSGAIDLLSDEELLYLIGHEVGHIKSRHTLYHQMADVLPILADILAPVTLGIAKLVSSPLRIALLHWSRMSEFTADRAGLLACQNQEAAVKVMMKWAGMPTRYYDDMKLESFIKQARSFEALDYDKLSAAIKFIAVLGSTHPWTIMRSAELLRWIESGEYEKVINRESSYRLNIRDEDGVQVCRTCGYHLQGTEQFCNCCGQQLRQTFANNAAG